MPSPRCIRVAFCCCIACYVSFLLPRPYRGRAACLRCWLWKHGSSCCCQPCGPHRLVFTRPPPSTLSVLVRQRLSCRAGPPPTDLRCPPLTSTRKRARSSSRTKCAAERPVRRCGRDRSALPRGQLRPSRPERPQSREGGIERCRVTNDEVKYGMVQPDHACAWSASWSCRRPP